MKNVYHEWLRDNQDVVGKDPALVREIDDDISLELYTGEAHGDPKGWITAVIAVKNEKGVYRFKYEGGSMQEDGLDGMANDCERYLRGSWVDSFDDWREEAKRYLWT